MNSVLTTDYLLLILSPEGVRYISIVSNLIAGGLMTWLAFAVTQDAGIRCGVALTRLIQRWALGLFALALVYNATMIDARPDHAPIGSALLVNLFIMVNVLISAYRHLKSPPIPADASWEHPMTLTAGTQSNWWDQRAAAAHRG